MFPMMPSDKIDQNIQLGWTTWPPELRIEVSISDICLATGQYIISHASIQMSIPGPCHSQQIWSVYQTHAYTIFRVINSILMEEC